MNAHERSDLTLHLPHGGGTKGEMTSPSPDPCLLRCVGNLTLSGRIGTVSHQEQQSRPCVLPGQHNRTDPVLGGKQGPRAGMGNEVLVV